MTSPEAQGCKTHKIGMDGFCMRCRMHLDEIAPAHRDNDCPDCAKPGKLAGSYEASGDPSAMGEASPMALQPLRTFKVWLYYPVHVDARSVQDALDLARASRGDWVCGRVEAT